MRLTKPREEEILALLRENKDAHVSFSADAYNRDGKIQVSRNNRSIYLHRYLYSILIGPPPRGRFLLKNCDRDGCQNPYHYRVFDSAHGLDHQVEPGPSGAEINRSKKKCPQGHRYTEKNTYTYRDSKGRRHRKCRTCSLERSRRQYQDTKDAS